MENLDEKINKYTKYCLNCKTKPCQKGCPLSNDIPTFIKYLKEKEYTKAYETLTQTTVLGGICGKICPHDKQCQGSCVRGLKGAPVCIGDLEAACWGLTLERHFVPFGTGLEGKKIAVIGGGPAGLSCATFIRRHGANVTIFEKYDELGGILAHGIPEFRLKRSILKECIQRILDLGIDVKYNMELGKDYFLEDLEKDYDSIFLGFGANISSKMGIEGEDLDGVFGGNELLENDLHLEYTGKNVAIIGGGNVAMDTARTIKKMGAKKVVVIYRRAEKQMPAEVKEIEEAKNEGVEFLFQNNIVKIFGNEKNEVKQIECIKTKLVKKEGEAREIPINIDGSNYNIDMDYVVMAVGSKTEKNVVNSLGIELTKQGYININENYMTSRENIYAGGDLTGGKQTVAWASKSGREAAKAILNKLGSNP